MRSTAHGSLARHLRRSLTRLIAVAVLALLGTPLTASAGMLTDCILQIDESSPVAGTVGTSVPFTIRVIDGGGGGTACSSASFSITEDSDTTAGSALNPPTSSGVVSIGTPYVANIDLPAAPNGGGSVTYSVQCTSGCDVTSFADPTFTVDVADFIAVTRTAPAASPELFVRTDQTPQTVTYAVQLTKNGSPSGFTPPELTVCFQLSNNPNGATFATSGPSCNGSGVEVTASGSGNASVDIDIPLQNPVEDTIIVTATATGASGMPFDLFELEAVDTVIATIVSGNNQTAPVNNPFPQPFVLQMTSNGVPDLLRDVDWAFDDGITGGSQFVPPGSSNTTTSPDANGMHQVTVVAGPMPIAIGIDARGACCGGDVREVFDATISGGVLVQFDNAPATVDAGDMIVLGVKVFNGGAPVADGTNVAWTFDTAVNGTLNGGPSAVTQTSGGNATVTFQANGPGPFPVRASVDLSGTPGDEDDDATTINAVDNYAFAHDDPAGGSASVPANVDLPLSVILSKNGAPVDGETVNYFVASGPPGARQFTPQNPATAGGGRAQTLFKTDTPGTYTVRAEAVSDLSATIDITVNVTAAIARTLTKPALSGDNASERPGRQVVLTVVGENDGTPESGLTIDWSIVSGGGPTGISLNTASSNTNPMGRATNVVTFGNDVGASRVRAERRDDPTVFVEFDLETFVYELDILTPPGGNGTATVGQPVTLGIQLRKRGIATGPLATRTIHWTNPSGSGTFNPPGATSDTDASGNATIEFTPLAAGNHGINAEFREGGPSPQISVPFTITATSLQMRAHASPSPLYTDETTASGVAVQTTRDNGATETPEANVPVSFFIMTPATATFVGGGTSAMVNSDSGGIAATPAIVVGRDLTSVVVQANSPGRPGVTTTMPVTASTYFASTSTPTQNVAVGGNATPQVLVERQGSGARTPLPNATVTWSATPAGGTLGAPSSTTAASGIASTTFTPGTAGTYTVTGTFDPQLSGVSPVAQGTTVTAVAASKTLEIVSGTGQSAMPGQTLASKLVVVAKDDAAFAPGVPVNWTVSPAGAGTVTPSSGVTSAADGTMSVDATIANGATPGTTVTFTATRGDEAGATASFQATVAAPTVRTLRKPASGSGDAQTGVIGSTLQPLVVIAEDDGSSAAGIDIHWTASGGAILSAPTTTTDAGGAAQVLVTLGSAPGDYVITATRSDAPSATSAFVVSATAPATEQLDIVEGDRQSGPPRRRASPLGVRFSRNGVPAADMNVTWSVISGDVQLDAPVSTTGPDGVARTGLTLGSTPGPALVRARAGSAFADFDLDVGALTASAASGDGQSGAPGQVLRSDFVVRFGTNPPATTPLDGYTVRWDVLSGGGTITPETSVTDAGGEAAARLTLGLEEGLQTVRATLPDGTFVLFTATATDAPDQDVFVLRPISGDRQQGVTGTRADAPLVVEVINAQGQPVANRPIDWTVVSGSAVLDSALTRTDTQGRARVGFRYGADPGPILLRADCGCSPPLTFSATARAAGIAGVTGDDQTAVINTELRDDLVVRIAPTANKALDGITVQWRVLTGGGSLASATSTTDANGNARNRWQLGPDVGQQRAVATLPGGESVEFSATALGSAVVLRIVSGDDQTIATNDPSAPMIVELTDGSGTVLPGVVLTWTGSDSVVLDQPATTTASGGRTQNVARLNMPGAASVRVRARDIDSNELVFDLNGGLVDVPGLDPVGEDTGEAIDAACAALAAAPPAPNTPEADFFARCSELIDNADDDPGAVADALGELPTDIGQTLSESALDSVETQHENISFRFNQLHGAQNGALPNTFNVGLWTPDGVLPLGFLPAALDSDGEDAAATEAGAGFDRWGFFATGIIGRGEADAGQRTPQFDYDISGLTAGVDYRLDDRLVIGGALGLTRNDTDLSGGEGTLETSGWSATAYASWFSAAQWYLDSSLTYGRNDYDLTRRINYQIRALGGGVTTVDQRADASTSGDTVGVTVAFGRDWQKGAWNLGSYLRGEYSRVEFDAYEERLIAGLPGQGLALAVDARSMTSMAAVVGGRATYVMSRDWGILMPNASIEWEHEFEDDPNRVTARFLFDPTGTPIEQVGERLDSNSFNVGLGVSALFPGGRSAYIYYEELVGASRLRQGILTLGVRFEF